MRSDGHKKLWVLLNELIFENIIITQIAWADVCSDDTTILVISFMHQVGHELFNRRSLRRFTPVQQFDRSIKNGTNSYDSWYCMSTPRDTGSAKNTALSARMDQQPLIIRQRCI